MAPKMAAKSAKYDIRLKCDKDQAFGVSLISYKRNQSVREVLVHDTALLFQYDITVPQMNYLDAIDKLTKIKPYKVPCSLTQIAKLSAKPRKRR